MSGMDNQPRSAKRKPSGNNRRNAKNAGFIALILLFGLIILAAYNQPSTLKAVSASTAIADTNAGKYSSIVVNNNELQITPKGQAHATLKSYVDANSSLKD